MEWRWEEVASLWSRLSRLGCGLRQIQETQKRSAAVLPDRLLTTIKRTVHNLHLAIDDVPMQCVQFQSRR